MASDLIVFINSPHHTGSNSWNCLAIWNILGRFLVDLLLCKFICVMYTNIFYIEPTANSCQVFIIINSAQKQPNKMWLPPSKAIIQVLWWTDAPGYNTYYNTGSYMERLVFCTLIKHMFKQICKRMRFHVQNLHFCSYANPCP